MSAIRKKSAILVFTGFNKCLFAKQKFDSNTEKELAEILERTPTVQKWFKINNDRAGEIFDIKYSDDDRQMHRYLPDFIVETVDAKYMIETKAANQMSDKVVQAKKRSSRRLVQNRHRV